MIENPAFTVPNGGQAERQQNRSPFIIRAHRLKNFYTILKSSMSVNDFVAESIEHMIRDCNSAGNSYTNRQRRETVLHQLYARDVLGSTQEQADNFRTRLTEFYEEFLQLPNDYPVKIVVDHKDNVCKGCAIGEHCNKGPSKKGDDDKYLKAFRKAAKRLNLANEINIVEETASYSDAKSRKVKSILTTAQIVKDVMLSGSPDFNWLAVRGRINF